jgi:hypothetical protein
MKKLFLILTMLSLAIQVSAQVTGKVVDGKQNPIPYVSCVLLSIPDSTFVSGTATHMDGYFELPVQQGHYIIQFSYLGYKTTEMECSNGDLGIVTLEEDAVALQEVVVKGEVPLVKMENNRLTYNTKAILDKKIVSNAHDLIRELPSVMSLDGNSLSVVGATSTTICISGKLSQLDMNHLTDYLKSLPADEVEKVEVIYNAPPQWHVKGSVINVVMKKKKNYTLNGQVQGSWSNQHENSFDFGGTVITSTPKWDFDLMYKYADLRNISRTETDGIHTIGNTLYEISSIAENFSKENRHSIYTNIGYKFNDNTSLSLSYNGLISPQKNSELYSLNTMFSDANSINKGNNNLHNLALAYTSQKGISAGVEYMNYTDAGTQDMEILNDGSFQQTFSYWRKQSIDKARAYFDMSHTLKNNWILNYGANYNYVSNYNEQENTDIQNGGENDYAKASEVNEHTAIAYIGFQKSFFNGKLSFNASLSGELYKINDYKKNALLPNAEITFVPSNKHIFQLSYNTLRTYPTYWQRQDFTSYSDEYTVYMGNPLLKPARTSNVNFTYVLKSKYIFQVSYYRVNDFFIEQSYQMPDELKLLYKSFNIDYTSNLTFTSIIPVNIGKWFSSNLILSAYNERYKSNDWYGYKYDRSKWTGMIMANNSFTISQKPKISANLMLFYRTPTIQGVWDLESNWGANVGIRYSFLKDNAILSLQCNDVFESIYPKTKVRFETQNQNVSQNAYNRNITLSFTYKFKGYKDKGHKEVDTSRFGIQ